MTNPLQKLRQHIDCNNYWKHAAVYKKDQPLHIAGGLDTDVYYIKSGAVYSAVAVNDHNDQIIRFGYAGDFMTALDSYLVNRKTIFTTKALRKTNVKVIGREKLIEIITTNREMAGIWEFIQRNLIVSQLDREIDLLTSDAAQRYRRVYQRSPRLFQEVPAKYIANYLRMSAETLSRIRAQEP